MTGSLRGARLELVRESGGFRLLFLATLASSIGTWLALIALVGPSLNARPALAGAAVAAVVALVSHAMPYKLGLFCGAIAGILAATFVDAWQERQSPPRTEAA